MAIENTDTREITQLSAATTAEAILNKRFVLLNIEDTVNKGVEKNKKEFRCWPHLGLLYVGTVAKQAGYEVVLHDELVEGYVDLEKLIKPGDIVGLSLVVTGVRRGIELAGRAKELGAKQVIAGNDSAIQGASEILFPDSPIDAVFTTSTLTPIREFFTQVETTKISDMRIPGMAITPPAENRSNEPDVLKAERDMRKNLARQGAYNARDFFLVPDLGLFSAEYWNTVQTNFQETFKDSFQDPESVRPALALFAQGCTRAAEGEACNHCTISDVAHVAVPSQEHIEDVLKAYEKAGINHVFNVTDSAYEMDGLLRRLEKAGAYFSKGLTIYARAWGLANKPELLPRWRALTGEKLVLNIGMESGSEDLLRNLDKASDKGSRLAENYRAIDEIAKVEGVFLHMSLICGNLGESKYTWEESLQLLAYAKQKLGTRLQQAECDIFWVNRGSPAGAVFHDYEVAQKYAAYAGKTISRETWEREFFAHKDELTTPWSVQIAWYENFTNLPIEDALFNIDKMARGMKSHKGAAPGRHNAFRPG